MAELRLGPTTGAPARDPRRWGQPRPAGFIKTIKALRDLDLAGDDPAYEDLRKRIFEVREGGRTEIVEALVTMEPTMRLIIEAAQPELARYPEASPYSADGPSTIATTG